MKSAQIGDKVCYAASFLRSIGGDYELSQRRGEVVEVIAAKKFYGSTIPARVKVRWNDNTEELEGALLCNLSKISNGKTSGIAEGIILE